MSKAHYYDILTTKDDVYLFMVNDDISAMGCSRHQLFWRGQCGETDITWFHDFRNLFDQLQPQTSKHFKRADDAIAYIKDLELSDNFNIRDKIMIVDFFENHEKKVIQFPRSLNLTR